jgi:hypothetical protein
MYFCVTGDGYFVTARQWTPCFIYLIPAELPTFLLALGTVVPALRNNLLFGFSFFITRIVLHIYLLTYSFLSGTDSVCNFFGSGTLVLHLHWFYGWFTKYGIYYITGKKKKSHKDLE